MGNIKNKKRPNAKNNKHNWEKRALFVGRFQPFHKGHLQILQKLLNQYQEVIVVLGSAEQPTSLKNPFTAGERIEMIRGCFSPRQLSNLIFVPVRDINNDGFWVSHLSSYVPSYNVIYSNNPLVKHLFSKAKKQVKQFKLINRQHYQGTFIRKQMTRGKKWQTYLPKSVVKLIQAVDGVDRIKKLTAN